MVIHKYIRLCQCNEHKDYVNKACREGYKPNLDENRLEFYAIKFRKKCF